MSNNDENIPTSTNEEENALIKSVFKDNEALLKAVRALFLGLPTTPDQKDMVKSAFSNPLLRKVMWKKFHPQLDADSPIGQVQDVWLGVENMVFGQNKDTIEQALGYKARALEYTKAALVLLDDPTVPSQFNAAFVANPLDELGINLLARNQFIRHVEQQLVFLRTIAQTKEPTKQELEVRRNRESAK